MNTQARTIGRTRTKALAGVLAIAVLAACGGNTALHPTNATEPHTQAPLSTTASTSSADPSLRQVHTDALRSRSVFLKYSHKVAGERFTKFLIDLERDTVTYLDVNTYPMHQDFVFKEIWKREQTPDQLAEFLANYDEEKPHFILGYLVYHLDQDLWTFAFAEGDRMKADHVRRVYAELQQSFFAANKIRFRPDSRHQEAIAEQLGDEIPVLTNDAIYQQSSYQPFNAGRTLGRLRIIKNITQDEDIVYRSDEIVILAETVNTISVVSGIISEQFSGPLSHASLRARAWGIPHIGLKNASIRYAELAGELVVLDATPESYTLRRATSEEVEAWKKRQTRRRVLIPRANLESAALRHLPQLRASEGDIYGAKAANLGEIARAKLSGFEVPPGFAIPIVHYAQHITRSGLDKQIRALLREERMLSDPSYRKRKLEGLRAAIRQAPMDKALLDKVMQHIGQISGSTPRGVFVRSSTNCEDLPGFSGAGLYDTVPNVLGRNAISDAIRQVWASVWNLRAFDERNFYGIDQRRVYAAVLIQVGVNATAAGVLVTADTQNPKDRTRYTINAKSGLGIRVVEGKKVPEQLLFAHTSGVIKVISRSDDDKMLVFAPTGGVQEVPTEDKGRPVLTDPRVRTLGAAATAIINLFPKEHPLDLEWLFVGDTLHIVQARPYVTP